MFLTQIEKAAGNLKNLPIWDFYCFWKCSWPIEEGGDYWVDWIFDDNNGTSIPSNSDRTECVYDSHKDSITFWLINHEKNFKPLGQATDMTK